MDDLSNSPSVFHGMLPPSEIVDLDVKEQEIHLPEGIELNITPEIPELAHEKLKEIAVSIGNNNVILVDDVPRICNMKASLKPEKDFTIVQAFAAVGQDLKAAPPKKVDLREAWWVVKDQGSTGACAGFSASSLLEYCFTKTNVLKPSETISPRAIWMAAKETDEFNDRPTTFIEQEGTSLTAVLKFIQRFGSIREAVMPFNSLYTQTAQDFYGQAAALRIGSYYNLTKNQSSWQQWISKYGPIYAAINVDGSWMKASKSRGVIKVYSNYEMYGGHAILICGYDQDKDYFICKNSWGTSWGDEGYAYCSSDWCKQAVLEAYGVSV